MRTVRVLVVDDSVIARRVVALALADEPGISLIGSAPNGRMALKRILQEHPDLVILDLEMPEMDGLETLRALRESPTETAVIVFSSHTAKGAVKTLDALQAGARDYVTKPERMGSVAEALDYVRDEMVSRVRALFPELPVATALEATQVAPAVGPRPRISPARAPIRLMVIGASTGGPNAVTEVLSALPAGFPAPILVVQHMPPLFTGIFAQRLDSLCALRIAEAQGGEQPMPGEVWVAPGGSHLAVVRQGATISLELRADPPEHGCRPAVDVLFRSAARAVGAGVLGLVLTGMGQDGTGGAREIVDAGGSVLAEDRSTAVAASMPWSVTRAGLVSECLPLPEIAPRLLAIASERARRNQWT